MSEYEEGNTDYTETSYEDNYLDLFLPVFRIILQNACGGLVGYGLITDSWVEPLVGLGIGIISMGWTEYTRRMKNKKIAELKAEVSELKTETEMS